MKNKRFTMQGGEIVDAGKLPKRKDGESSEDYAARLTTAQRKLWGEQMEASSIAQQNAGTRRQREANKQMAQNDRDRNRWKRTPKEQDAYVEEQNKKTAKGYDGRPGRNRRRVKKAKGE